MNILTKSMFVAGLAASLIFASSSKAAELDVNVDVNLPNVLILYAYTDIDLTYTAGEFASLLGCTAEDCTSALTTAQSGTISSNAANLDIASDLSTMGSTTITLQNSWAVRGLGHSSFTASIAKTASSESAVSNFVISPTTGTPSMKATAGDVSFDIDLTSSDLDDGTVTANYTVTVTGS